MSDSTCQLLPPAELPVGRPRDGRTGPRSSDGKARSSENAITHGCRSEKLILRHEDPAEFESLRDAWFEHYGPESKIAGALLEETVRAHWFLKRAQKQLDDIVWELPANAYHWTEEHERLYRNFTRYKNSHERTFFRFFKELEAHFRRNSSVPEMRQQALVIAARLQKQSPPEKEQTVPEPAAAAEDSSCFRELSEASFCTQPSNPPTPRCRT
jgi:hypothetical protein